MVGKILIINSCASCPYIAEGNTAQGEWCNHLKVVGNKQKKLNMLWWEIPNWCPLPDAKEADAILGVVDKEITNGT